MSTWSVKIERGQAFIYLGKEKLKISAQSFGKVLAVKKSEYNGKTALMFTFEPPANDFTSKDQLKCHLKLKSFRRLESDGIFKEIKEKSHAEWISRFNQEIQKLYLNSSSASVGVGNSSASSKRSLSTEVAVQQNRAPSGDDYNVLNSSVGSEDTVEVVSQESESIHEEPWQADKNTVSADTSVSGSRVQNPPIVSSPLETANVGKRKILDSCIDISPIHRAPRKKISKQSVKEDEGPSNAQFVEIQKSCERCRVGTYFLPIKQLHQPKNEILIRKIDPIFLEKLQRDMELEPEGNYGVTFVLVRNCHLEDFKEEKLEDYEYDVIWGLHNMTAAKALHAKYPENTHYRGRHARVYCGLSNEEALWLASRHNITAAMRHEMSFVEEVEVCRAQLFSLNGFPIDLSKDPPEPAAKWRDTCAKVLSKKKKLLSDVFSMAQLPARVWMLFTSVNKKFEDGALKDAKPARKNILTKMRMKAVHFRNLSALSNNEKEMLLRKVDESTFSIDEMKMAADDIKKLRPIQEAIMVALKLKTWEEVPDVLKPEVTASGLARFMGRDTDHAEFQDFLKRLQARLNDGACEDGTRFHSATDEFALHKENSATIKGYLFFNDPFQASQQKKITDSTDNFRGAFLTIHQLQANSDEVALAETKSVVSFVQNVNFSLMTTFNICLVCEPIYINKVVEAVIDAGGVYSLGFIHQKGYPISKDSQLLPKSTASYVIGHWHISRKIVSEHFSFEQDEVRDGFYEVVGDRSGKLPPEAFSWLITHFSHAGDYVIDLLSTDACTIRETMKNSRHGILFGREEDQENVRFQLASLVQPRKT